MNGEEDTEKPSTDPHAHSTCLTRFTRGVKTNPTVIHMLISMHEAGFPVKLSRDFSCEPCPPRVAGGFDPFRQQIVLCENSIYSQIHMNEVLTHELVHAFDDKTVNIDWHDLKHLACTEIRAANLSGECSFSRENLIRFNFGFKSHNRDCVKNRAALSISTVKAGVSYENAREIVESVFDRCYAYTRPFEGIPPLSQLKSTRWQMFNYFSSEQPYYYEDGMTFSSLLANHNPMKDVEIPNCPDDSISMIKFSPNANYLLCASWDNTVRCWEVAETGPALKAQIAHEGPVLSCCWHSDGTKAFTVGCDNYAKIWDLASNQAMNIAMHESPIKSVHWIDGKTYSCLMTGSWDKTLKFWDTRSPTPQLSIQLPERCYCLDVVFPLCVVGTANRGVALYNLENQPVLLKQIDSPLKYQHRCVSIFADKDKPSGFALGSIEGRVAIHYINTPNPSVDNFTFKCHRSVPPQNSTQVQDIYVVNDISVHPTHGTLATVGSDCKFSYWDKNARTKLKTSEAMTQPVVSCDFNFNGQIFGYAVSYDWSKGHERFDPSKKNYIFLRKADEELKPRKKR